MGRLVGFCLEGVVLVLVLVVVLERLVRPSGLE